MNEMNKKLDALLDKEDGLVTNLSNASALLNECLENINWVGFYLLRKNVLCLGPFQGKTACVRIPVGKGVCGSAVAENRTMRIENVHEFPGHIACDCASQSEIVVPIRVEGEIKGVLDIDSPTVGRFAREDEELLEESVRIIENIWGEF